MTQQQLEKYLCCTTTIDAGDYNQYIFPSPLFKRIYDVYDKA